MVIIINHNSFFQSSLPLPANNNHTDSAVPWNICIPIVTRHQYSFVLPHPFLLPLLIFQQIVPAHLATSPIPTESHLFWISEVEQRAAKALEDDPVDPDDPPEPPAPATVATKKKKRRRKKHKGDPRREELTPPMSVPTGNANAANAPSATTAAMSSNGQNEEIFDMDLSSDDEAAARVSRSVYCLESLNKRFIFQKQPHHTSFYL